MSKKSLDVGESVSHDLIYYVTTPIDYWGFSSHVIMSKKLKGYMRRVMEAFSTACPGILRDLREGPFPFILPSCKEMTYGFVFKQDNGTTHVLSPVPLVYLEEHCIQALAMLTVSGHSFGATEEEMGDVEPPF